MTITVDRLVQEIRNIISEISEIDAQRTDLSQTILFLTMKKDRLKRILDAHVETGEDICVLKLNQEAVESTPHYDFHKQIWGATPMSIGLRNSTPVPGTQYNHLRNISGV